MRNRRNPRIQYVYAAGPAGWITDAWTMKRTIARKMIDMSSESKTLGSAPGAIRSEIMTRSSSRAAITTSRVVGDAILHLETGVAQEGREQLRAHRERVQDDVLVIGVRAASDGPQSVENGDPQCAHKVAVGAAAGGAVPQIEPEPATMLT